MPTGSVLSFGPGSGILFGMSRSKSDDSTNPRAFDWRELPDQTNTFFFPAPSGPLAVAQWGPSDGTPVLLVPGITGSKEDFSLIGPKLGARGYCVWAIDLAGQYQSYQAGPGGDGLWSVAMHLRDIEAILEKLGAAHCVGYSYGGIIGRQLLVERPEIFRSMMFLSVPPTAGNAFSFMKVIGPLVWGRAARTGAALLLTGIKFNVNFAPRSRYRFVRHRMGYTVRDSVVHAIDDMMNIPDLNGSVRAANVPLMVGAGAGDLWSLKKHRDHAESIGATFREYQAGHSPAESAPDDLLRDLVQFYEQIDAK